MKCSGINVNSTPFQAAPFPANVKNTHGGDRGHTVRPWLWKGLRSDVSPLEVMQMHQCFAYRQGESPGHSIGKARQEGVKGFCSLNVITHMLFFIVFFLGGRGISRKNTVFSVVLLQQRRLPFFVFPKEDKGFPSRTAGLYYGKRRVYFFPYT